LPIEVHDQDRADPASTRSERGDAATRKKAKERSRNTKGHST